MLNTLSKTFIVSIVTLFCSGVQASSILDDYDGDDREVEVPDFSMVCKGVNIGSTFQIIDNHLVFSGNIRAEIIENKEKVFVAKWGSILGLDDIIIIADYELKLLSIDYGGVTKGFNQFDCM